MNLEQAAAKALSDVKNLVGHFGEGQKAFDQLEEQIKKVAQEVHTDWPPALQKAKHLLEDVKRLHHELDEEAKRADQILKDLKQKMDSVHQEALDALHGTRDGVHGLEQFVHGLEPELAQVLHHAEETGQSLRDGANHIYDTLHHQVSDVGHHLHNEVVNGIKEFEGLLEDHSNDYHEHVTGSVMPEIEAKHDEAHQHLQEEHDQLEEKLSQLHQQKQEQVTQSMEQCHDKHNEVCHDFGEIGQQAEQIMGALSKAVDAGGTAVSDGMTVVGAACDSLGIGLKLCIDIFAELDKLFKDFSFLGL